MRRYTDPSNPNPSNLERNPHVVSFDQKFWWTTHTPRRHTQALHTCMWTSHQHTRMTCPTLALYGMHRELTRTRVSTNTKSPFTDASCPEYTQRKLSWRKWVQRNVSVHGVDHNHYSIDFTPVTQVTKSPFIFKSCWSPTHELWNWNSGEGKILMNIVSSSGNLSIQALMHFNQHLYSIMLCWLHLVSILRRFKSNMKISNCSCILCRRSCAPA